MSYYANSGSRKKLLATTSDDRRKLHEAVTVAAKLTEAWRGSANRTWLYLLHALDAAMAFDSELRAARSDED
jgi:hypothetical protein